MLVPYGLTPHQYAAKRMWLFRREKYGTIGCSPEKREYITLRVKAALARRHYKKSDRCQKGHKFTPENTYWKRRKGCTRLERGCKACSLVWYGKKVRDKLHQDRMRRLREEMINSHPDKHPIGNKSFWTKRFIKARREYEKQIAA